MADNKINVGGRLHSIATGNVLTGANEIFDDDKNKKQSEINTETYVLVNDVNEKLSGLNPEQQSALSVASKATNNEIKLGYYVCSTEANVSAKVISDATGYVLSTGGSIKVKMTNANIAADATLNINSTGAKPLYYDGERASTNNSWEAGETVEIYYDGTSYYANNVAGGGGDGVFDVSEKYPTSGVEGGNTYTLQAALTVLNANLPASKKKGGMSIKFVQSFDNKYIQARCMAQNFTTDVTQWQGVDDEPTAGSENLVKSGGIEEALPMFELVGKGNTFVESSHYSVKSGVRYAIWVKNPNIPVNEITLTPPKEYYRFSVRAFDAQGTLISYLIGSALNVGTLNDKYEFITPDDTDYIVIGMRANQDEILTLWIENILSTDVRVDTEQNFTEEQQNIGLENLGIRKYLQFINIKGNGDNVVTSPKFTVKSGDRYVLNVKNPDISMTGVDTSDYRVTRFAIAAYNSSDVKIGNDLVLVGVTGELSDSYEFVIPDNAEYITIRIRAAVNAVLTTWIEDITFLSQHTENKIYVGSTKLINGDGISRTIGGTIRQDSENKRYIKTDVSVGTVVDLTPQVSEGNYRYSITDVTPGDIVLINGSGGGASRLWAFLDSTNHLIVAADADLTQTNFELVAPSNAAYLIINNKNGQDSYYLGKNGNEFDSRFVGLKAEVGASIPFTEYGKYINTSVAVGERVSVKAVANASYNYFIVRVKESQKFCINGQGGVTPLLWCFVDNSFISLAKSDIEVKGNGLEIIAPANATYLIVNSRTNDLSYYKGYSEIIKYNKETLDKIYSEIQFVNNVYYNVAGNVGDIATLAETVNNSYKSAKLSCQKGDNFIINATAGGSSAKAFTFVDSNNVILYHWTQTSFNGAVVAPDGAAYVVISSKNKNLMSYAGSGHMLIDTRARVLRLENKELDYYSIQSLGTNNVFSSFQISMPSDRDCTPMIVSARAKYETSGSKPTIRFSTGLYSSIQYTIGEEGEFSVKEWRIPPVLFDRTLYIIVNVPSGCTLTITDFSCHKDRIVDRKEVGVRLDAHLGFQGVAPENTMAAYELAAQCGYPACIINPIVSADGTIYCYHEDDACLSYNGGSTPVALSAAQFNALTDMELKQYRVIGYGNQQTYYNEKIPTLDEFFYLCSLTGMRPIFSTHPALDDTQWLNVKNLLIKYRLLDKIIIKAFSVSILEDAINILGNIKGVIYDVNGTSASYHCDEMDKSEIVSQFKGEKGIEYVASSMTSEIATTVLSRGYFVSVWDVGGVNSERYKELINWGVSEFVDDYNCSSGLNF